MKRIILLLSFLTSISFAANPFDNLRVDAHRGVQKVPQQFLYAKRAAELGVARAQFDLALMYARGAGVKRDEREAFKWFHKAARNHHVEAKFYMGLSFAQGRGVKRQPQLARYWFKLAAKAGHQKSVAYLAAIEHSLHQSYIKQERIAFNTYR